MHIKAFTEVVIQHSSKIILQMPYNHKDIAQMVPITQSQPHDSNFKYQGDQTFLCLSPLYFSSLSATAESKIISKSCNGLSPLQGLRRQEIGIVSNISHNRTPFHNLPLFLWWQIKVYFSKIVKQNHYLHFSKFNQFSRFVHYQLLH